MDKPAERFDAKTCANILPNTEFAIMPSFENQVQTAPRSVSESHARSTSACRQRAVVGVHGEIRSRYRALQFRPIFRVPRIVGRNLVEIRGRRKTPIAGSDPDSGGLPSPFTRQSGRHQVFTSRRIRKARGRTCPPLGAAPCVSAFGGEEVASGARRRKAD